MELFCCPICSQRLHQIGQTLKCGASHHFDISREGYVNLLPSHHRRSFKPGDDAATVSSRRRFLDAGFYDPLVRAIESVLQAQPAIDCLADLGCSEGFFSNALGKLAPGVYGIDISKPAIRAASKRYKSLNLAVASITRLPLPDKSLDVATLILAPFAEDIARIIRPGGLLLRVSPGAEHLAALKERIYRAPRPHQRATLELHNLGHEEQLNVTCELNLDKAHTLDLVAMTPMQHRTSSSARALLKENRSMVVGAEFWIDVFKKPG
jgi:23S rRNA (guanine745-N1)-methyltransferase